MVKSKIWIGSVVVNCDDFSRMVSFWQEALHYVPREAPGEDSVVLKDPEGQGPNVTLIVTNEGPLDQYRLHLDLYSYEPEEEVERLLGLGATRKGSPEKGQDFTTLADPEGNLFDVIDKRGWDFGQRD
jgi:hypothetical protein